MRLSEKVAGRLRQNRLKARTITLKIRLTGFETYTRALTLPESTGFDNAVYQTVKKLVDEFDCKGKKIRLLGIKASNFSTPAVQTEMFSTGPKPNDARTEKLHQAIDKLKEKFGDDAICRGTSIQNKK